MKCAILLAAVCACLILSAACNKNDDDKGSDSATAQLLQAGKWQLIARTATTNYNGTDTTADYYALMEECDKDDFILFAGNGICTIDENTNKCADDQQIETATWALLDNDTRITIADSNPETFDLEVSGTELKLKITTQNSSGVPIYWVNTYKNIK